MTLITSPIPDLDQGLPDYYKPLSIRLYDILEDIGATEEIRQVTMNSSITKEILQTIIFRPKLSTYIFGSVVEGTTTQDMGSDVDTVYIFNNLPVIDDLSKMAAGEALLLVQDWETPAGYCKLQLAREGIPLTENDVAEVDPASFGKYIELLLSFSADKHDRLVCSLKPSEDVSWWFSERHGPALSLDNCNIAKARDVVHAFKCDAWPDCASEWLSRKRNFNWPTQDTIESCKSFGFICVPVGHPHSDEQNLEWRISLSQQERYLVTRFNSVQLKCYIILKLIKKEKITTFIGESLSSYHMKTSMFYTIENTPKSFWTPGNLLGCVSACLRRVMTWVESGICPNYFIPEENMFEGRVTGKVRVELGQLLKSMLLAEPSFLVDFESGIIGDRLQYHFVLDSPKYRQEFKRLASERCHYTKVFLLESEVNECFRTWRKCLPEDDSIGIKEWTIALKQTIHELQNSKVVSQHTEEETRKALSYILPYIELSYQSSLVALEASRHGGNQGEELRHYLTSKKWKEISERSDSHSSRLKQALFLHTFWYFNESIEVLRSLYHTERLTICACYEDSPIEPDHEAISKAATGASVITTEYLIHNIIVPCVFIPPAEKRIVPTALNYEMIRTVCIPEEAEPFMNDLDMYYGGWAFVDAQFLVHWLMYLNHNCLNMEKQAADDIDHMKSMFGSKNLCHEDACLNLLGWIYKERRDIEDAMHCFVKSLEIKPVCNAALWHIIILTFEEFKRRHLK